MFISIFFLQMTGVEVVNGGMGIKNPLLSISDRLASNPQHFGKSSYFLKYVTISMILRNVFYIGIGITTFASANLLIAF